MSQVWVPPPGPSFELSSIFWVPPTKLTILYLSIKTGAPYPSRISRYGPSNRACRSPSEKKNIFIAFLGVLNVSKTFNFWPVLEGFFGEKIIFFGPRPQVWVPSPGPAFELSAICLARPTKPTTLYFSVNKRTPYPSPLSRYRPSNRACRSLSEKKNIFIAFLGVLSFSKTFNFCRYFEVFLGKKIFFGPIPQVWVPPPGPPFELSSIFFARPTKLTTLYLSFKTGAP